MKLRQITLALGLMMASAAMAQQFDSAVGWAAVDGMTTGSCNRNPVVV